MIELNALSNQVAGKVQLSSSKSISNRLLILSAMAKNNLKLSNLSDADDTKLLDQILSKPNLDSTIDCHHARLYFNLNFLLFLISINNPCDFAWIYNNQS